MTGDVFDFAGVGVNMMVDEFQKPVERIGTSSAREERSFKWKQEALKKMRLNWVNLL